jgi:hypothetical protein
MHFEKYLPFLNLASRIKGWKFFFAIWVAILFCVAVVFLFPGDVLGHSQPFSLLAPPLLSERSGTPHSALSGLSRLPLEAQSTISAALGRDIPSYQARAWRGGIEADNARQKLVSNFSSQGVEVHSGHQRWRIALRGYGYGDILKPPPTASPRLRFNRVEYQRGTLTEWYVNGPLGLEQGITLQKRPGQADGRPLTIALAFEGDLNAAVDEGGTGLTLTDGEGQARLRYRGLFAYDATGRKLPTWLEVKGTRLLLKTDDTKARYPVVVDPVIQLAELTASDGAPNYELGASVAVSGNTVVAGEPGCPSGCDFVGAAYVFVEPETGWANMTQTAKLTASDGVAGNGFGFAVGISGKTIVVGAHGDNGGRGAAYVFVEPATGWADMTETAKLTASDSTASELVGRSVSISGDTVVAGAPNDTIGAHKEQGAAYVFVEPASGWANMTQTAKLTASDGVSYGELGYSVAIDSNTVVAGEPSPIPGKSASPGTAYVFVEPAAGWATMTQTAELTASDGVIGDRLGNFVAISGNTVVAGAPLATIGSHLQQGAAYVFGEPASGWANMTQTAKLTSSDGVRRSYFGRAVAISGSTAVVGAPNQTVGSDAGQGAAYDFVEPAGGWADMTETAELDALHGSDNDEVGDRVSVDGTTAAVGALGGSKRGAVLLFPVGTAGGRTPTFVQTPSFPHGNGGGALTVAFGSNVTSGNSLWVGCFSKYSGGGGFATSFVVSDTLLNSWTSAAAIANGQQIFYAKNITGGTDSVTCTPSGTGSSTGTDLVGPFEVSGASTTAPLDAIGSQASGTGTAISSTVTTSNANDLLVSWASGQDGAISHGTYIWAQDQSGINYNANLLESLTLSTSGSQTCPATQTSSAAWWSWCFGITGGSGSSSSVLWRPAR